MYLIHFFAILGLLVMNVVAVVVPTSSLVVPTASLVPSNNHSCNHLACFDPLNRDLNHGITNSTKTPGKSNLLVTNVEGWAEKQIRVFYDTLGDAGHDVILSAPPTRRVNEGNRQHPPTNLDWKGCHYHSCPGGKGGTGFNQTNPRLNWVNAAATTCIKYGLENIWPRFQLNDSNGDIDLVLIGPGVGSNRALKHGQSGTTGAASFAAKKLKMPSIIFAGWNQKRRAWNLETEPSHKVYAELAKNLTNRILANGKPYLPPNTFLNVNFPRVDEKSCNHGNFKYVLTGTLLAGMWPKADLPICKKKNLPAECVVVKRKTKDTCYVSISPMDTKNKGVSGLKEQLAVLKALEGTLSCYPEQSKWKEFWAKTGCAMRFWEWI